MTTTTVTLVVGLSLLPLAALAQPGNANVALREQIQALRASGFSGMTEIQALQAPAAANAAPASAQVDETTKALAALLNEAKDGWVIFGETARTLGLGFTGDLLSVKGVETPATQDVVRFFYATSFRGSSDIIISEVRKVNGRKEMRSYLVSMNGTLEAAALTVKVNGKVQAEAIAVSAAQAGYRELLEFWTRYYRDNLKNP